MFSLQDRMIVAENCEEYKPKNYMLDPQASYISNDCNSCINFSHNKCKKNLIDEIGKMISIN